MANINFSDTPYYDDYVPSKRFQKILYKPSFAVQSRELNQSQSIINENIKNISNVILDSGDPLKPGQLIYSNKVDYITLDTLEPWNNYHFNAGGRNSARYLIGKYITDAAIRIKAQIITGAARNNAKSEAAVLYIAYTYSDGDQSVPNVTFASLDDIYELKQDGTRGDKIGNVGRPDTLFYPIEEIGQGSIAQIKDGIYYVNGMAVGLIGQTLILEKFGITPTYRIGLVVEDSILTVTQDTTLYDPRGSAPGADRYKISLKLAKKSLTSPSNDSFIELMKVTDGHPVRKDTYLGQLFTEDDYTDRHSKTFGNYVERPFNIEIREHESALTDHNGIAGIYSTDGDTGKMVIGVDGGSAVLNGKSISIPSKQYVNIDKQRGTSNLVTATGTTTVAADFGSYVVTSAGLHTDLDQGHGTTNTDPDRAWLNFSPQVATLVPFGQQSTDSSRIFLGNTVVESLAEASIRNIERDPAIGNNVSEEYRIYLFDIQPLVTTVNTSSIIEDAEFLSIKSQGTTIDIDTLVENVTYVIIIPGSSNFTLIGAADSVAGTEFVATGAGTGDGTAAKVFKRIVDLNTELGSDSTSSLLMQETGVIYFQGGQAGESFGAQVDFAETAQHYTDTTFTTFNDTRLDSLVFPIPKDAIGDDVTSNLGTTTINRMRATHRLTSSADDYITFTTSGDETFDITNNIAVTEQILSITAQYAVVVGDVLKGSTSGAYGRITISGSQETGGAFTATNKLMVVITDTLGNVDTSGSPTVFQAEDYTMHIRYYEEEWVVATGALTGDEFAISSGTITAVDERIDGHRNKDYLLYGAAAAYVTKNYFHRQDALVLQFNNTTAPTILTIKSPRIMNSKDYVLLSVIKTAAGVEIVKEVRQGTKHITKHETTSTLSGDIGHIQLDYADVLDKNWKVYENKNGFQGSASNQATTSDTDISNRYTLNTGQRDNSYSVGFLQLKDNKPMPVGSLYIVYYYLQHGTDVQQIGQSSATYRLGDFISVDSYPIGSTGNDGFGTFTYEDIPTFTSPTTGKKIRLANAIDFRPVKDASDHYLHNTRIPFHTTVDIASLKYFRPRVDKVYLTEGETLDETFLSSKMEKGEIYKILTVGTTNFTSAGAESNTPGVIFRAKDKLAGTGTVTIAEGNLRVVKGIPYESEPVIPIVPENGIEIAEIKIPAYTHSTDDVKIKPTSNLHRKELDSSKLEKVLENLQDHLSKRTLEEKSKTYDIGVGRKVIGTFTDSFEGHDSGDVADTYYSVSIDRINNVLRPEFIVENVSWNLLPVVYNDLTGSAITKNLLTLPLVTGDEYTPEVRNVETNIEVKPRTTHTFGYHGYMILTPSFDNWKSTKSRPDLLVNKNNEFDSIKHQKKPHQTHRSNWNDWQTHWSGYNKVEFEKDDKDTSYEDLVKSLKKTHEVDSDTLEINDNKKLQRDYVPYIRSQNIKITVYGLKPNVGNLRIRFDGRDITSDVRTNLLTPSTYVNTAAAVLKTDDYGTFVGWFTIPNIDEGVGTTKYTTGKKKIVVDSTIVGVDSYAEGTFNAVGYVDNKISTRNLEGSWDTQTRDAYHQAFEIFEDCFAGKVDLYFTGKENYGSIRPIILQLRKMDGDHPSNDCLPFSTVVKYPTDTLTFTGDVQPDWDVGDTLTGLNSGAKGVIIDFPTSNTAEAIVRPVWGEWNVPNETVTNGTDTKILSSVVTGIPTDGTTATTFTFSEFVYLPKGRYCITLLTSCRSYQLKALDVNRLDGSKMTGVGSTFQGRDEIRNQILQFVLWRCKFDTSLAAGDATSWLKTLALPDISPTKDNPLYTYGHIAAEKNQIRVDLDSHGYATISEGKLTFKGVSGRNSFEANLVSSTSAGSMGVANSFVQGEIIYQRNQEDADEALNVPNGILVDFEYPSTIKVMMNSTGSFENTQDPLWGATSEKQAVIHSGANYAGANHYKRMMNGIDLEYINNGAVIDLDDGTNLRDPVAGGSGYVVTTLEDGDPTTGGTGTGLTVRVASVADDVVSNYDESDRSGGIWVVNPGSGYTDNDLITVIQSGSDNNATIRVRGVRENQYQIVSSTHDTIDVKRVGTGNVFQPSGTTSTVDIKSFYVGRTNYPEASMKVSSDLTGIGPRRRVDLLHYSDAAIVPESTRLTWERADEYNGTLTTAIPEANIQLETNKLITDNTFLKNVFSSEYDRVTPVIDKAALNTTMVSNRIDNSSELSSYISRKVRLKSSANSVKVILDAVIPGVSTVNVYVRTNIDTTLDIEDNVIPFSDNHLWIAVVQQDTMVTDDRSEYQEIEYLKDDLGQFSTFQIKVAFKSSNSIIFPKIKNILAIANQKDDSLLPLQSFTIQGDLSCDGWFETVTISNTRTWHDFFAIETDFKVLHGTLHLIERDGFSGSGFEWTAEPTRLYASAGNGWAVGQILTGVTSGATGILIYIGTGYVSVARTDDTPFGATEFVSNPGGTQGNGGSRQNTSVTTGAPNVSSLDFVRTSTGTSALQKIQEFSIKPLNPETGTGCIVKVTNYHNEAKNFRFLATVYGR